jgi:hypothetical protein
MISISGKHRFESGIKSRVQGNLQSCENASQRIVRMVVANVIVVVVVAAAIVVLLDAVISSHDLLVRLGSLQVEQRSEGKPLQSWRAITLHVPTFAQQSWLRRRSLI